MEEKQSWRQQMRWRWLWLCKRESSGTVAIIIVLVVAAVVLNLALQVRDYKQTTAAQQMQIQAMTRQQNRLDENGVRIDRLKEFYGLEDPYDAGERYKRFGTDAEFREFCQEQYPEAVYPSTEWTVEEIIKSYYDTPEIWAYHETAALLGVYLTWSEDYRHCFVLDMEWPYAYEGGHPEIGSGWLVIDGVRTQYLDEKTYFIDWPLDLVLDYRNGTWDGSLRRSEDGLTTVSVDMYGALSYKYEAWFYDETTDPDGLAYGSFNRESVPWWRDGIEWSATGLIQPQLEALRDWDTSGDEVWEYLETKIYVEAPYMTDGNRFIQVLNTEHGLLCLASGTIYLYESGEEVQKWVCTGTTAPEAKLLKAQADSDAEYAEDLAYFYDGKQLRALKASGEMTVVIDTFVQRPSTLWSSMLGMKGDRLIYYNDGVVTVVAEGVLETDFSTLRLIRKVDGWYVVMRQNSTYTTEYLGSSDKEEYIATYTMLRRGA